LKGFEMVPQMEGLAVELIQERATKADLALLEKSIDGMRSAAREANFQNFYRSDLKFHRTLWSLSGNRFLQRSLDITIVPLFAFFIMKNPRDSTADLLASAEKHADVVKAIRDSENARQCMESALQFFAEQEKRLLFDGD